MLDIAIGLGQLFALTLLFVGLVLLSARVREAIIHTFVIASLDRIGQRSSAHALELAEAMCRALYIDAAGKTSPRKTFIVGSIAALFVGAPVAFILMFWWGGSADINNPQSQMPMHRLLVWHLLPLTVLFHWAAEFLLASVLWNALQARPRLDMWRVFARVSLALVVAIATPLVLSNIFFRFQAYIPEALTFAWGFMLNGPGVLLGYLSFKISPDGSIFWLAVASCLTFATAILLLAVSSLLVRTKIGYSILATIVSRTGRASGPALIALAAGLFGLLTDISSSKSALGSLLGL